MSFSPRFIFLLSVYWLAISRHGYQVVRTAWYEVQAFLAAATHAILG